MTRAGRLVRRPRFVSAHESTPINSRNNQSILSPAPNNRVNFIHRIYFSFICIKTTYYVVPIALTTIRAQCVRPTHNFWHPHIAPLTTGKLVATGFIATTGAIDYDHSCA